VRCQDESEILCNVERLGSDDCPVTSPDRICHEVRCLLPQITLFMLDPDCVCVVDGQEIMGAELEQASSIIMYQDVDTRDTYDF
jgi:hypothetical protein